ncbi:hypothetical protein ACFLRP_01690 [Bacteroidota bacterium]
MIRDKALDVFLMLFFSSSGLLILIFAFSQPMGATDRAFTIVIGSAGVLGAMARALVRKAVRFRTNAGSDMIQVRSNNK